MGVFEDKFGNKIAFTGSMNESLTAMDINYESIDVYCDWKNQDNWERVSKKNKSILKPFGTNEDSSVETMDLPEAKEKILNKYKKEEICYEEIKALHFDESDKFEEINNTG